jgi:hypothetical protein
MNQSSHSTWGRRLFYILLHGRRALWINGLLFYVLLLLYCRILVLCFRYGGGRASTYIQFARKVKRGFILEPAFVVMWCKYSTSALCVERKRSLFRFFHLFFWTNRTRGWSKIGTTMTVASTVVCLARLRTYHVSLRFQKDPRHSSLRSASQSNTRFPLVLCSINKLLQNSLFVVTSSLLSVLTDQTISSDPTNFQLERPSLELCLGFDFRQMHFVHLLHRSTQLVNTSS